MPKIRYLACAALLIVSSCSANLLINHQSVSANSGCDDVKFVFARGSGESLSGPSYTAWYDELSDALSSAQLNYSFYELGSESHDGYQYPAVTVSDGLYGYSNLLGAYIGGGAMFEFGNSVREGQGELKAYMSEISRACPKTKFVLGGYSQGAMLITSILDQLDSSKIIYVATFGDPKLYLPEGYDKLLGGLIYKVPDACRGIGLSPYREYVPDCYAYEGVLGSYRPYQPKGYSGKLGTWCNKSDIMCSSGLNIDDHTSYVSENLYYDAAALIVRKISKAFSSSDGGISGLFPKALHNVAFVFDSTESMEYVINLYRAEAKRLAEKVQNRGGKIALVEYRDLVDNTDTENGGFIPRTICDFTCTLDTFNASLDNLALENGGDAPESALSAIMHALNHLEWQNGATKSVILVTDNRYHPTDHDGTTLEDVIQRSLEIDPVNVYVVSHSYLRDFYSDLTEGTNGGYVDIYSEISSSTATILGRPVAKLALSEYTGSIGDEFIFDASGSYAMDGGELAYEWDLNNDGRFDDGENSPIAKMTYDTARSIYIRVKVTDSYGNSSTMSAKLTVWREAKPDPLATIQTLTATNLEDNSVEISFTTTAPKVLLKLDDIPQGIIEPKYRAGNFTLGEIRKDTTVTLVPYSSKERRGISSSLLISLDGEISPVQPIPTEPETPNPSNLDSADTPNLPNTPNNSDPNSPNTPSVSTTSSTTASASIVNSTSSSASPDPGVIIPKAPNTGIRDAILTQLLGCLPKMYD